MKETSKTFSVSEILGISGKYQILQYFYLCLPAIFVSMTNNNYIFVANEINYRCRIPECEILNDYNVAWWPKMHVDHCTKPILNKTLHLEEHVCTNNSFTITTTEICTEWIYENNNSIVSKFDLACQPWKRNLIGVVHSIGMAFAMLVAGWMCDNIGRKPTMIICAVGGIVGNLKTLATSYSVYMCLEFLEAAVSGGVFTAGTVLMIEIGNQKNRVLSGVLVAYAIYMGEAVFAIIAMFVPYWKNLIYAICSPSILFLIFIKVVRESPRWLILKGKVTEAKYTLEEMAKMNKININKNDLDSMDEEKLKEACKIESHDKKESFKDAFRCREVIKRFFVAFLCRFAIAFIYFGLVVNSVWLPGNKYVNFLLGAVMSFPGELVSMFMMNKFGRRLPLIFGFLLSGIACIIYGYVPETYSALKIVFFLIGKLIAAACYTGIVTYTMELFPTTVRGSLLGLCTLASCSGNMAGLLTPMLASVYSVLAAICFGCAGIISSLLLILTPETRDLPLADTIEQIVKSVAAEKENRNKKSGKNNNAYSDEENVTNL